MRINSLDLSTVWNYPTRTITNSNLPFWTALQQATQQSLVVTAHNTNQAVITNNTGKDCLVLVNLGVDDPTPTSKIYIASYSAVGTHYSFHQHYNCNLDGIEFNGLSSWLYVKAGDKIEVGYFNDNAITNTAYYSYAMFGIN